MMTNICHGTWRKAQGRVALCALPFALALLLVPRAAAAQGPMVIEPIGSGWVATPEIKQTEVDSKAATMIGGSAGYIANETFFVGGAGYWLANGSDSREMGYGGFVMQWFVKAGDHTWVAPKMLLGGGTGTLTSTVTQLIPPPVGIPYGGPNAASQYVPQTVTSLVRVHNDFFVFEPELDAKIRISRLAQISVGGGYRFVSGYYGYYPYYYYGSSPFDSRFQGWVGSVGVQFGGGF